MSHETKPFDASFILTFDALDLEDAELKFDDLLDELHELGFRPNGVATIEEAIELV